MMPLSLTLRLFDRDGREKNTFTIPPDGAVIGRTTEADLSIDDPDKTLSRRHCEVRPDRRGDGWIIIDISTNGTFLNDHSAPIGADNAAGLSHGDLIRLGAYQLRVELTAASALAFTPPPPPASPSPFSAFSSASAVSSSTSPFDDFDLDLPGAAGPTPLPPKHRAAAPPPPDPDDPFAAFDLDLPIGGGPAQSDHTPFSEMAFTPPPTRPAPPPIDDFDEDLPAAPLPPSPAPPPRPAAAPRPSGNDITAFLAGAGMEGQTLGDIDMQAMGRLFRAFVEGMRGLLEVRAQVKNELRVERTIIGGRDNNPLKFALTAEDALAALLAPAAKGYLPAETAVGQCFDDLKLHELALMVAVQEALQSVLKRLSPTTLKDRAGAQTGNGWFANGNAQKAKLWDLYEALSAELTGALKDDFDSMFGAAFARAYEKQVIR